MHIQLIYDNDLALKAPSVMHLLDEPTMEILRYPPKFSDLAPCNNFFVQLVKNILAGKKYVKKHFWGSALFQCPNSIPKKQQCSTCKM